MDIEIISERKNPHLSRIEIHFVVKHPGGPTPKRDVVQGAIANMLGVKKDVVIIDHFKTNFGSESARGYAKVYSSVEACMRIEREPVLVKNRLKERKKVEKPAESSPAKKEEKPPAQQDQKKQ